MKNLQRVVWAKGMFLNPQHFQAQERFLEDNLQFRLTASSPVNYGLTDFSIDEQALANGMFTLRLCRGVMPDGLSFHIPECDEAPVGRSVDDYFSETAPHLDVFLVLPERRGRGRNVTIGATAGELAGTRYVSDTRTVVDDSNGTDEKSIQFARKNFRLAFGGEILDGTSALRIARITRDAAGTCVLKRDFVGPSLSIAAAETLLLLVRRQVELLAAKAASLSNLRRQKGRSLAEFGPADVPNFWLLHTVNTYLPPLRHIFKMRHCHPETLYRTMLGLAGALTTFSLDEQARNLPDYDHEDLGGCFAALDERIRALLETAIPTKCIVVPLTLVEKSTWAGRIADENHFKKSLFFLSVSAQMGADDIIKQTPKQIKISPMTELQRLIRNALPGVGLRHVPVPPAAVPVRLDRQYFALNQTGILWDGIVKSAQLGLFIPEEFPKPEVELLIVLE